MKKMLSVQYSTAAFNVAMLLLRLSSGVLMMSHGYYKLVHFAEMKTRFFNFMGIGSTLSLALAIFAEFFCSMFVIMGLFTRFAVTPIIIIMSVAVFQSHDGDIFGKGEKAVLFLACFITILLCGPGKASVDGMMK